MGERRSAACAGNLTNCREGGSFHPKHNKFEAARVASGNCAQTDSLMAGWPSATTKTTVLYWFCHRAKLRAARGSELQARAPERLAGPLASLSSALSKGAGLDNLGRAGSAD